MNIYRVVICGAGSIGALKPDDVDGPGTAYALTHAHAWGANPRTLVIALVDTDPEKRERAEAKWKVSAFGTIGEAVKDQGPADVIVIATPERTHLEIFTEAIQAKPRLVVIEKPCGATWEDACSIRELSQTHQIPVVVNYTRRFCPAFRPPLSLAQRIADGEVRVQHARLVYGRGLLRDGCHALDLFRMLFGEMLEAKRLGEVLDPRLPEDPSITAWMRFERCNQVLLCATDSSLYSVFELDIWTENEVYRFGDHGNMLSIYIAEAEVVYGRGYRSISGKPTWIERTELTWSLRGMVWECVAYLDDPSRGLSSTVENAVKVHEMIERLRGGELR